jgi:hypothetical protein
MILHDLDGIVKPGNLIPLERIFGVDLTSLMMIIRRTTYQWGDMYPVVNTLIGQVLNHVRLLNVFIADGGNWADATCSMCWEFLTMHPVDVTTCGHTTPLKSIVARR